uniref:tetratricopeptide repeat protein n=1 Tax=Candidatus Magnetaquicoccus inordinatus TaxID=2496818 RepID=UPI00102B10F4
MEESAADLPAPLPQTLAEEGWAARQAGDLDKAWNIFEALRKSEPGNPEWLHQTSMIALHRGETEQAEQRIMAALTLSPHHPLLTLNLAEVYFRKSQLHNAHTALQQVIQQEPDNVRALCLMGKTLLRLRRNVEAIQPLQRALQIEPHLVTAHHWLANAYYAIVYAGTVNPRGLLFQSNYHARLARYYEGKPDDPLAFPTDHALFLQPHRAYQAALHNQNLLCYYLGNPIPDAPSHLLGIPGNPTEVVNYFVHSRLPFPADVEFNPAVQQEAVFAGIVVAVLNAAHQQRLAKAQRL